ncbi:unnamed protein product [Adineta ricciae]|uniref:G-protein coupled receptors family 1 profile domain-containing protein n=1 Tax=Adineta ricciae TaxID=249248 RepID=A0A815MFD7_ADIRI|nr:unnamed protein product [Adineta ricciae]CAF1643855.1 unnamed protein product [Adineta ricciae]
MSTINSSNNDGNASSGDSEISPPRVARFWFLLVIDVPSVVCTFCIIIHIVTNRARRHALQNHTILVILLINLPVQLPDIILYLNAYQNGLLQPSSPAACLTWWFIDITFYNGGVILLAWMAIERHILIFHYRWIMNRRRRFLFHYLPLVVLVIYTLVFYIIAFFFIPCENGYDYTVPVCGESPCYQSYGVFGEWDLFANNCAPIILESVVSIGLILRVQWQKRRLRQSDQWRKQQRMIIQLCLVSGVNMCINLPIYLITFAHLCGLPSQYGVQASSYFYFFSYLVTLLFPFTSLSQYPELRKVIKKIFCMSARQLPLGSTVVPARRAVPTGAADV